MDATATVTAALEADLEALRAAREDMTLEIKQLNDAAAAQIDDFETQMATIVSDFEAYKRTVAAANDDRDQRVAAVVDAAAEDTTRLTERNATLIREKAARARVHLNRKQEWAAALRAAQTAQRDAERRVEEAGAATAVATAAAAAARADEKAKAAAVTATVTAEVSAAVTAVGDARVEQAAEEAAATALVVADAAAAALAIVEEAASTALTEHSAAVDEHHATIATLGGDVDSAYADMAQALRFFNRQLRQRRVDETVIRARLESECLLSRMVNDAVRARRTYADYASRLPSCAAWFIKHTDETALPFGKFGRKERQKRRLITLRGGVLHWAKYVATAVVTTATAATASDDGGNGVSVGGAKADARHTVRLSKFEMVRSNFARDADAGVHARFQGMNGVRLVPRKHINLAMVLTPIVFLDKPRFYDDDDDDVDDDDESARDGGDNGGGDAAMKTSEVSHSSLSADVSDDDDDDDDNDDDGGGDGDGGDDEEKQNEDDTRSVSSRRSRYTSRQGGSGSRSSGAVNGVPIQRHVDVEAWIVEINVQIAVLRFLDVLFADGVGVATPLPLLLASTSDAAASSTASAPMTTLVASPEKNNGANGGKGGGSGKRAKRSHAKLLRSRPAHTLTRGWREVLEFVIDRNAPTLTVLHTVEELHGPLAHFAYALAHRRRLNGICLQYAAIGDATAAVIAGIVRHHATQGVRRVDLAHNIVTATGVAALADALTANRFGCLDTLTLDFNAVGDAGAMALAGALDAFASSAAAAIDEGDGDVDFCTLPLRALSLRGCQVGTSGAVAICNALQRCGDVAAAVGGIVVIERLDFAENCVEDDVCAAVAALIAHSSVDVRCVDLSCNLVSDAGMVPLAAALAVHIDKSNIAEPQPPSSQQSLSSNDAKTSSDDAATTLTLVLATNRISNTGVYALADALTAADAGGDAAAFAVDLSDNPLITGRGLRRLLKCGLPLQFDRLLLSRRVADADFDGGVAAAERIDEVAPAMLSPLATPLQSPSSSPRKQKQNAHVTFAVAAPSAAAVASSQLTAPQLAASTRQRRASLNDVVSGFAASVAAAATSDEHTAALSANAPPESASAHDGDETDDAAVTDTLVNAECSPESAAPLSAASSVSSSAASSVASSPVKGAAAAAAAAESAAPGESTASTDELATLLLGQLLSGGAGDDDSEDSVSASQRAVSFNITSDEKAESDGTDLTSTQREKASALIAGNAALASKWGLTASASDSE
jgi:hypothetical protein